MALEVLNITRDYYQKAFNMDLALKNELLEMEIKAAYYIIKSYLGFYYFGQIFVNFFIK
jgi:hypothetical protein